MVYNCKKVFGNKEVTWLRLIQPYDGYHRSNFPENMKVGDITWVEKEYLYLNWNKTGQDLVLIEGNRYGGNFELKYFEIMEYKHINYEPQYEIY